MSSNWADLKVRILSAVVMLLVGGAAIWAGGIWFAVLIAICAGAMIWELSTMLGGGQSNSLILAGVGVGASVSILVVIQGQSDDWLFSLLPFIMVAPAILGAVLLSDYRRTFALYSVSITTACAVLLIIRHVGLQEVIMLIAIVVVTDVAGYFAGKVFGGPKFWPKVSPKKTWSGTASGWIAAGLLAGIIYTSFAAVIFGMVLSFASQMGDIAESALKRKMGVKDASNLIPGHGGVFDRFDGLIGASLAVVLMMVLGLYP